jgi:hypothetical protein
MLTTTPSLIQQFYDLARDSEDLPWRDGNEYIRRFDNIQAWVRREIYPHITALAALQDVQRGFLTGHDERHTFTVMHRASSLIRELKIELSPFEFYVLLVAALIHDVGNIKGRSGHERQIRPVVNATELKTFLGSDTHERSTIIAIAEAHGGTARNDADDKDTLKALQEEDFVDSHLLRPQLLAAILRLADEIAEEPARASRFALQNRTVPESEIYHAFALTVNTVRVNKDHRSLDFIFTANADDMLRRWSKINKKGEMEEYYLLEYIFERALKTYLECRYCVRYMRAAVPTMTHLDAVKMEIKIYGSPEEEGDDIVIKRIADTIRESGYPGEGLDIRALCPGLANVTGESVKAEIEAARIASSVDDIA